jgi:hypothetical protein
MNEVDLMAEARARLDFGDSPEEVLKYLKAEGVPEERAQGLIELIQLARNAPLRVAGVRKISTGITMMAGAVPLWFVLPLFGAVLGKLQVMAIGLALYGWWRIAAGVVMLMTPQRETKDGTERGE